MRELIAKEDGTVWDQFGKQFPTRLDRYGYPRLTYYLGQGKYKTFVVHRLIAKQLIPNPNNYPQINHKDFNKQNNSIDNLEWCTISRNIKHAYDAGVNKFKPRKGGPRGYNGRFIKVAECN